MTNPAWIIVFSITSSSLIFISTNVSYVTAVDSAANDDIWYIGKGVQENMYLTYKIRDNNAEPYFLTIYFEKKAERSWTTQFIGYYLDIGRSTNQTILLSDFNMSPGNSNITKEMEPFVSGYQDALQYMWTFSVKPGHSLSRLNETWNEVSFPECPECTGPKTTQIKTVQTPAGKFNATLVSHETGLSVWITKDLPFPIVGVTYVGSTLETVNTPHEFELQEVGNGYPAAIPEFTFMHLVLVGSFAVALLIPAVSLGMMKITRMRYLLQQDS